MGSRRSGLGREEEEERGWGSGEVLAVRRKDVGLNELGPLLSSRGTRETLSLSTDPERPFVKLVVPRPQSLDTVTGVSGRSGS